MALLRQRYADFGPELAREYLAREHGYAWSTETLRGWMIAAGLWQPKRRRAQRVHSGATAPGVPGRAGADRRQPPRLVRRPGRQVLLRWPSSTTPPGGSWQGASSRRRRPRAGLGLLREVIERHGAPLALYSDRHGIFTKPDPEDPKPTQFERALLQLDIEPICAHTPQAKGRVERLFQTLQDRLCKAMRLEGISGNEQANVWLAG